MIPCTTDEIIFNVRRCTKLKLDEKTAQIILEDSDYLEIYKRLIARYDRMTSEKMKTAPELIKKNEINLFNKILSEFDDMVAQILLSN